MVNDFHDTYGEFPLAYLITIRCYGAWLHGDKRLAVDRHAFNSFGAPRRPPNEDLEKVMRRNMKQSPVLLSDEQREVVRIAITEVCRFRKYDLKAVSVQTNHLHVVVSAPMKPEAIANSFKSYATRRLRERGLLDEKVRPWARGQSRRYLWKPEHVSLATDYVRYWQDGIPSFEQALGELDPL